MSRADTGLLPFVPRGCGCGAHGFPCGLASGLLAPALKMLKLTGSRRGMSTLFLVVAALSLLLIFGFSSWFVGVNLSREVAMAEAGRTIRLACESSVEEAIEGFIRSVNLSPKDVHTDEERIAQRFGEKLRRLRPGKLLRTRFVPGNTRKALKPLSIDVDAVEVTLFNENTADGQEADKEACKKLLAVMQKWSKMPG